MIVGSGAAGAILAYELAARGKDVILLERGALVDRSEFSDNEPAMFRSCTGTAHFRSHATFGSPSSRECASAAARW